MIEFGFKGEYMITTVDLKKMNKSRIFQYIHYARETSRQDIGNKLDLSLPTINQNLKSLKEAGLIHFVGSFDSTGGRKAQTIVVNEKAKLAISVNIKNNIITAMAINLKGTIVATISKNIAFKVSEKYSKSIGNLVDELIDNNRLESNDILGVGITIPGVFDKSGANIIVAPILHAYNFEVSFLSRYIDYPCIVVNDAKSGAYAEIWYNGIYDESKKLEDLEQFSDSTKAYLLLDKGVGGAIIQGAKHFEGIHNRAGEFGHMTIVPGGKKCECGKQGCLEAYVSTARLSDDFEISLEEFFKELERDNKEYKKVFNGYLDKLCIAINNIYTMLDSEIIIGGNVANYIEPYLDIIKKKLQVLNSFDSNGNYLKLSHCEQQEASIGVALMFIGEFIQNI